MQESGSSIHPRGIYSVEDEHHQWLKRGVPVFDSKEECTKFVKEHCQIPSNPRERHLQHIFTLLTDWNQVKEYLIDKRTEYENRLQTVHYSQVDMSKNRFLSVSKTENYNESKRGFEEKSSNNFFYSKEEEDYPKHEHADGCTMVVRTVRERLDLPFHRRLTPESTINTLQYLFYHMRCGIYVMIRGGKLCMFVPFVNTDYQNTWGDRLRIDENFQNLDQYYTEKEKFYRKENFLPDKNKWWANGNIICNEHHQFKERVSQYWGDQFSVHLRHMLETLCNERQVPDCEFFMNKRDYPQLKVNVAKGEPVEPYGFIFDCDDRNPEEDIDLNEHKYETYAPIVSFYAGAPDRFADIPWPPSEDWDAAVGKVFPSSFFYSYRNHEILLKSEPRDLFTEENFRKFDCTWSEKVNTAFFRGTATGGGTTIGTNQRLALANKCYEWSKNPPFDNEGVPILDAQITGWNLRDKKITSKPMTFLRPNSFAFVAGKQHFVPIYEQSRFKYLIYVEGHCAACRYGFLMRLGSVILKVESSCVASQMWYFPMLRPFFDHVPVKADLSDLDEKIKWCRENDDECFRIAKNARKLYDDFISREGILDYLQFVCYEISARTRYPPNWFTSPPEISIPRVHNVQRGFCFEDKKEPSNNRYCIRCREDKNEVKSSQTKVYEKRKRSEEEKKEEMSALRNRQLAQAAKNKKRKSQEINF